MDTKAVLASIDSKGKAYGDVALEIWRFAEVARKALDGNRQLELGVHSRARHRQRVDGPGGCQLERAYRAAHVGDGVPGSPAHSWQAVAAGGTSIGVKGMLVAAKSMALTAIDLFTDPSHTEKARAEFDQRRGPGFKYTTRLADRKPALDYRTVGSKHGGSKHGGSKHGGSKHGGSEHLSDRHTPVRGAVAVGELARLVARGLGVDGPGRPSAPACSSAAVHWPLVCLPYPFGGGTPAESPQKRDRAFNSE